MRGTAMRLGIVLIAGLALIAAQPASAKSTHFGNATNLSKLPNGFSKVTKEECDGLGGTVKSIDVSYCASAKACYTTDVHGVIHYSCYTESAQ